MTRTPRLQRATQTGSVAPSPNHFGDLFSTTSETRASEATNCRKAGIGHEKGQKGSPLPNQFRGLVSTGDIVVHQGANRIGRSGHVRCFNLGRSLELVDPSIVEHLTNDDDPGLWDAGSTTILTDAARLAQPHFQGCPNRSRYRSQITSAYLKAYCSAYFSPRQHCRCDLVVIRSWWWPSSCKRIWSNW